MKPILINTFLILLLTTLLFFGGLGKHATVFLSLFILFILFIKLKFGNRFKYLNLPEGGGKYILFLLLFVLSFLWSKNITVSFISFFLFFSGFIFWVFVFNFHKVFNKLDSVIIGLGVFFGLLSLINLGSSETDTFSLVRFAMTSHHHHIGDFWAVVLIILGWRLSKNTHIKHIFPILPGIYFLLLSLSRSAYIALIVGSLYLIKSNPSKRNSIFWIYIIVGVFLFLYASTQKSTLLAHSGYLIQGVIGSLRYPFGVGVGNFEYFSVDSQNTLFGLKSASTSAHNIFLEITSGMGILGLSFIAWFIAVIKDIFEKAKRERILYKAIFVTLSVNFLFDYTYLIPTMLWIWFMCLGLSQAQSRRQ